MSIDRFSVPGENPQDAAHRLAETGRRDLNERAGRQAMVKTILAQIARESRACTALQSPLLAEVLPLHEIEEKVAASKQRMRDLFEQLKSMGRDEEDDHLQGAPVPRPRRPLVDSGSAALEIPRTQELDESAPTVDDALLTTSTATYPIDRAA